MAKNTGTGGRTGIIADRTQTYNPKTGQYIKRDEHGKFMASKDTPYKNIRRDKNAKEHEQKINKNTN
jgi:hypothetical protein